MDANAQAIGLPWPVVRQIENTHEINLFGVPPDVAEAFIRKYSYFTTSEIPANTYKGGAEAIPTLSLWNFMAVHKDASEELVYKVLKATFDRTDILIAAHKSAQEIKAENIVTSPIPLHPAAVRFFREEGIKLPDRIVHVQ